jgi:hypothetical protein
MNSLNKQTQNGSSVVIALVFMVGLFIIVTSALAFQRSTANNLDQASAASSEKWSARSVTSRAAGWVTYKLPEEYSAAVLYLKYRMAASTKFSFSIMIRFSRSFNECGGNYSRPAAG